MNKLVAFDLDGTLSESDLFLLPAYRYGLKQIGRPEMDERELKELIGGSAEDNCRLVAPDGTMADFREFERHVIRYTNENAARLGRAFPQTAQSLAELKHRGYTVVLCSNAPTAYSGLVLEKFGLQDYFDEIPQSEDGWDKGRLLRYILETHTPDAAVMVGDRHFDMEAARENQLPFIGIGYGLFPAEITAADAVIDSADCLPAAVDRLLA